jgi:hypothetical protein
VRQGTAPRGPEPPHRNGTISFLLFVELYLKHGRLQQPSQYAEMKANAELRQLVATLWGRGGLIYGLAESEPPLGMNDAPWKALVLQPDNKDEVVRFLCDAP